MDLVRCQAWIEEHQNDVTNLFFTKSYVEMHKVHKVDITILICKSDSHFRVDLRMHPGTPGTMPAWTTPP